MNVAVIGKEVQIELDSPSFNLIGFEHQPKTKKQKKKVKRTEKLLANTAKLISIENNSCKVEHVTVGSPFAEHDDHKGHDDHKEHKAHDDHKEHKAHDDHAEDTHSEYALEYHFVCDAAEFTAINFSGLLSKFPNFSKIRVQWLSNDKQGDAELSANNQMITIK